MVTFTGNPSWNNQQTGLWYLIVVAVLAGIEGIVAVLAIGGGDMPVSISFLNSLSGFSTSGKLDAMFDLD